MESGGMIDRGCVVYTCVSDSVLAQYIPSANTKMRTYEHKEIPYCLFDSLAKAMECLKIRRLLKRLLISGGELRAKRKKQLKKDNASKLKSLVDE
ncbi:hypothetical protein RJ641_004791, partial [Dillenia turbinata]